MLGSAGGVWEGGGFRSDIALNHEPLLITVPMSGALPESLLAQF